MACFFFAVTNRYLNFFRNELRYIAISYILRGLKCFIVTIITTIITHKARMAITTTQAATAHAVAARKCLTPAPCAMSCCN